MIAAYTRKAMAMVFCLAMFTITHAQTDMFINAIGKTDQSADFTELKNMYHLQAINESHYQSKEGVEVVLQNSIITEIRIYKESSVYGTFKGKLPKGLTFGISPAQVKTILGKPSVSYNTGYCEFEVNGKIISCWFEKDHLNQIDIGSK